VNVRGIHDSLLHHNELHWGAMVANGVRYLDKAYYDVIAFRSKENSFGWDPARGNLPPHGPIVDWGRATRNFTIRIDDTWPPLRVQSAFGGVGVYKVASSLIPHPSSRIPLPSSLISHPSSLIRNP